MPHEPQNQREIIAGLTASRLVFLVILMGLWLRLFFMYTSDFPLNDGGMFYTAINDIITSRFSLPRFMSYNGTGIPFAYPPLAFYAAAAISKVFGIPVLTLLRYLPVIISTSCIPLAYAILRRLMKSPSLALLATFIFAITPRSYEWIIMGGGLTRATGFFFSLAAILFCMRYMERRRAVYAVFASIALALTVMSHLEMAIFGMYSMILFAAFDTKKRDAIMCVFLCGIGALALCSPWLYLVVSRHGFEVFVSAFRSGFWSLQALTYVLFFTFPQEIIMPVIAMLGLAGFWMCILRKDYKTPMWLTAILLLNHRSGATMATLPLAALTTHALSTLAAALPHPKKRTQFIAVLLVLSVVSNAFGYLIYRQSSLQALELSDRAAMQWVHEHVDTQARFLIINPLEYSSWALDKVSEWFPALAERKSVLTMQGLEWLPNNVFMDRYEKSRTWKLCNNQDIRCYEQALRREGIQFDHVYVSDVRTGGATQCCSLLLYSLRYDKRYMKIYDNGSVSLWRKSAQKP